MSHRKYFKEDHLLVMQLRKDGKTLKDIREITGFAFCTISGLARHGQNLPWADPLRHDNGPVPVFNRSGEELFQHDPYYTKL